MKHLLPFRVYEAGTSVLTPDQEAFLNEYTDGTWSVNPETGLVDVSGNFNCEKRKLKTLLGISFGHVSVYFSCAHNQLTTLEGAPQTVGGDFYCGNNRLTTLVGAPQTVDGGFVCSNNQLTSLEGAPRTVNGNFYCYNNRLTTLEEAPQTVGGRFNCDAFELERGEWNPSGWVKILITGDAAARKLILTLPFFQPDWWNSELQRDPGKTVHLLASCWNRMPEEMKSKIVIPPGYEDEFGLFSGFDNLGLF